MTELRQNRIQSCAFVFSACTAFVFSCVFVSNFIGFGTAKSQDNIRLVDRINPNNASVASMARLPGIGIAKAEAIVTYRKKSRETNGESQPFQCIDDLQKVNGIGPKTVQNISDWLKLE